MAILGAGSQLKLDTGSGLTTVAGVESIDNEISIGDVDTSDLLTTSVAKTYIAGWLDAGTVDMTVRFTAAQYNTILGQARVSRSWQILLSNGSAFNFTGYWNKLGLGVPLETEIEMPFSVKISGLPTFTP
jgi:hypothetical protein